MLRAPKRPIALVAGLLLLVAAGTQPQPPAPPPALAGPLAPLAAQVQWVRAHSALAQGQGARAFVLMRSAVALEPASISAWTLMANQLGLQLASPESGRPAEERAAWLRAALTTLEQGESEVHRPEALALHGAILLISHAETDPDLPWPGGTRGLFADAAERAERALALAHLQSDHVHDLDWEASVRGLVQTAEAGARGELPVD